MAGLLGERWVYWRGRITFSIQARRQLNWNGRGMDSQYKLLSELLSDQSAFITSPKTSLANCWGAFPPCLQCLRACNPLKFEDTVLTKRFLHDQH